MLPTPDTSHVPYDRVYEPAEDSFLLLDTLSSASETHFLHAAFSSNTATATATAAPAPAPVPAPARATPPLVVELGTGSGVVLAFVHAHAATLFGTRHVLTAGIDINAFACRATVATVAKAQAENPTTHGLYLGSCMGDLVSPLRPHLVDVLVFNPPYVPTSEMPARPAAFSHHVGEREKPSFDDDSYLLALSYAGGRDGMETTDRVIDALPEILSARGCAYILLCAQNKPEEVKSRIQAFGPEWRAQTVGSSGKTAGWEKLQVVRIWREDV